MTSHLIPKRKKELINESIHFAPQSEFNEIKKVGGEKTKMNFLRKIKEISIPSAILLSGIIIGFSIFFTTWIFFGGDNNRQKLFTPNPQQVNRNLPTNTLTPAQLQLMQQQRAAQLNQNQPTSPNPIVKPATTTPTKTLKK